MAATINSEIKFLIELDENRVPEKLTWTAQDGGVVEQEAKAIMLSIWDAKAQETLRIDLWTKDMPVDEMKRFCVDNIGSMAENIVTATNDQKMAEMMRALCKQLSAYLDEQENEPRTELLQ